MLGAAVKFHQEALLKVASEAEMYAATERPEVLKRLVAAARVLKAAREHETTQRESGGGRALRAPLAVAPGWVACRRRECDGIVKLGAGFWYLGLGPYCSMDCQNIIHPVK